MHQCHEEQLSFQLVFADTSDALRFCIVTQVALLYEEWPQDSLSALGGTVVGLDNKLLFKGPRMALALVASSEYTYALLPWWNILVQSAMTLWPTLLSHMHDECRQMLCVQPVHVCNHTNQHPGRCNCPVQRCPSSRMCTGSTAPTTDPGQHWRRRW